MFIPICFLLISSTFLLTIGQVKPPPPPGSPELCRNNEHVAGRWVNGSATKKLYYSCSWHKHDNLVNPTTCGWQAREGEHFMRGHQQWLTQTGGHAAECDRRDNTRYTITQRERYEWEPIKCDLVPWNVSLFCESLGDRKILMMGDSIMHQTGAALMSRITWDATRNSENVSFVSCAPQLALGRMNMFGQDDGYGLSHIQSYLDSFQRDVLILNTGAHFLLNSLFDDDLQLVHNLTDEIVPHYEAKAQKNLTVAWKSMNPGHVNCSQESHGPLNDKWDHRHTGMRDLYNWWLQPDMDSRAKRKVSDLGWKWIDMSPLYYRQDAHPYGEAKDCLHYCLPGPPDLFSVLVQNMLYNKEL